MPSNDDWLVVRLGDLIQVSKGVGYKGQDLKVDEDTGDRLLSITAIEPGGGFKADGLRPYRGRHRADHRCLPGEIVLALTDLTQQGVLLGSPALVPSTDFGLVASHHVARIFGLDTDDWTAGTGGVLREGATVDESRNRSQMSARSFGITALDALMAKRFPYDVGD